MVAAKKKGGNSDKTATDKYEVITAKIIALMEQGKLVWEKPWHSAPPCNLVSGHKYRGSNPLLCGVDLMLHDWEHPFFLTYKQAEEMGWYIRKGTKATSIMWGGTGSKEVENEKGETKREYYSMKKFFPVFNVQCVDDSEAEVKVAQYIEKYKVPPSNNDDPIPMLEAFVEAQGANIKHGGASAFYAPGSDRIMMPAFNEFKSAQAYYMVLVHELVHRTGHSSRLKRPPAGKFGSKAYAKEELVAELGSAFISNALGIDYTLNHAGYLQLWMGVLKEDNKAFFTAVSHAQKAADLLLLNAGLLEDYTDEEEAATKKELVAA